MGDQRGPTDVKFDTADAARVYADIATKSGELLSKFFEQHAGGALRPVADELGISKAFFEAWARMLTDPVRLGADPQLRMESLHPGSSGE